MFASASLAKESVERIISTTDSLVRRHLSIWLDTVLKTVELPTGISNLDSRLSSMNGDALTLCKQINIQNEIIKALNSTRKMPTIFEVC